MMLSKYTFLLFLNILIFDIIISHEVVPQYGKLNIVKNYFFIDTRDFKKGDMIYISITIYYEEYNIDDTLTYNFYESIDSSSGYRGNLYVDSYSSSYYSSFYEYEETFNYKIEKTSDTANYLYIHHPFYSPVEVENFKKSSTSTAAIIAGVIVGVFILAFFIVMIICVCRRCKRTNAYGTGVVYPSSIGYGISPYAVQPGVVIQPAVNVQPYPANQNYGYEQNPQYNQNVQYNQDAPNPQQGSDYRMNQENYCSQKV